MQTTEKNVILVIEDSAEDFETIEWMLRKTGHDFALKRFEFSSDALDYLKNNPLPSLILLDLNLNETGGHETLKIVKTGEKTCIIPVIVVTTSTAPKDIEFCYRNGAAGYINKPVNFDKFSKSLHILMDYWFEAVVLPDSIPEF